MSNQSTLMHLQARLRDRRITYGSWIQLPSADVAEIVADGFDWIVIDREHGALSLETVLSLTRVIQGQGKVPFVRLMSEDPLLGRKALDAGCAGLIIPHVSNAKAFARFVHDCTWPPNGSRSIGFFRANKFGQRFEEYAEQDSRPIFIPMIEDRDGLSNLDAILATGMADAVLIGPYDLSASLGAVGDFNCQSFRDAEDDLLAVCAHHGVSAGIHDVRPTPASIADKVSRGYTFIACGMDTVFLTEAVANVMVVEEAHHVDEP